MASIINTIVTKFTADGAEQTAAATENVTKAQTRLGQTSASNGRQFAAQSQGLGGLVAAYAGAAATSFALQQAFAALQKAAQFDQIIQGTNAFTSQFGQSAESVLRDVKRITQGQLSIAEAATSANIALSAGFSTKQLTELADVATKSSRALGRDLQDSFQRLVRGSAKLEAELLDELGIFTRIEPAVEKYAAAVGKSTTALSEFERRQAFVNSVIAEGQSKFAVIDTSNNTAAQSYARLAATITDLALTIGNVIANALVPLAEYINNNLSAAFGTFGVITALILSKTNQLASEGLKNLTDKITTTSGALSTSFVGSGKAAAEVLGELSNATDSYNTRLGKGLGDQKARRDELINFAKAGTITVNQVRELNTIVEAQKKRDEESKASLTAKLATLDKTSKTYERLDKDLKNTNISLAQNERQIIANNKVLAEQSKLANAAAVSTALFGKAVGIVGSAFGKALSFLNVILTLYSVLSLIGPLIAQAFGGFNVFDKLLLTLGEIGKNLLGLDKNSKALESGIQGYAAGVAEAAFQAQNLKGNVEGIVKEKALFGLFTIDVKINAETIQKTIADAIAAGTEEAEKARSRGRLQVLGSALEFGLPPEAIPEVTEESLGVDAQARYNAEIERRIKLSQDKLLKATDASSLKLVQAEIEGLKQIINLGKEQLQIVGLISADTGISAKELFKYVSATREGTLSIRTLNGQVEGQVYTIEQILALEESRRKGAQELTNIQQRLVAFNVNTILNTEKLNKAQLDLNGIGKARSDLLATEEEISKQIRDLQQANIPFEDSRLQKLREQLDLYRQQRTEFNKQADVQESILRVQDSIRKTFSSQINALNNITGLVDASGKLATDDLEVKRNQLDILKETAAAGDQLRKSIPIPEGETLESTFEAVEKRILEASDSAKSALAGSILESIKKAAELTKEYEKQTIELQKQALTTRINIQKEDLQLQQQINEKQKELNTLIIQNQINAIARQQRVNELSAERIDILRKGREEEAKSITSGVLGPLFTDQQKRLIEIRFKEEELNDLKRALGAQVASAKQTLDAEVRLARENSTREDQRLTIQRSILELDATQKATDIGFRIEETKRQQEIFIKQSQAIQEQIKAFLDHPRELAKVLSQNVRDLIEVYKVNNPERAGALVGVQQSITQRENLINEQLKKQIEDINRSLTNGIDSVTNATRNNLIALQEQEKALGRTVEGQRQQLSLEKQISDTRTNEAVTAAQARYNAVVLETGNRLLAAQQSLEILKREAERAGNSFIIVAVRFAESVSSNLEKGINSLVDAIANGTLTLNNFKQGFKQFIISILSDVTKAILNELITKPIKELVFGFTRDLISGLSGSTISETLAKNITPAISSSLTSSLGENITKSITGLKDIGITPVYVTNMAEFCACASGGAAAQGGAGAASTLAQGGAGRLMYDRPIGPMQPPTIAQRTAGTITQGGSGTVTQAGSSAIVQAGAQNVVSRGLGGRPADAPTGTPTDPTSVVIDNPEALTKSLSVPILSSAGNLGATGAAGAAGAIGTEAANYGALNVTRSATQPLLSQPLAGAQLTSPAILGSTGINTNMGPAGFQSTFGVAGSYAGNGMITNKDFNTVTGTYGMSEVASPLSNINTGFQPPTRGVAFGDTSVAPGFDKGLTDTKVIEDFSSKLEEVNPKLGDFSGNFDNLNPSMIKWGENTSAATGNLDQLSNSANGLTNSTESMIPQLDMFGTATGMVTSAQTAGQAATVAQTTAIGTNTIATQQNTIAENANTGASGGGGGGFFSWIGSLFGFGQASGGLVMNNGAISRFAAGGGVMMRDRVPSLLEPGEFVMKKTSVDSIGKGNLERMNATGKSSGSPTNIKVQIENKGSEKEAQQGETQMDGETAIVKLILKDLNSNGPIRRSIRGNM